MTTLILAEQAFDFDDEHEEVVKTRDLQIANGVLQQRVLIIRQHCGVFSEWRDVPQVSQP